jgi:hypothetical protein
MLKKLLIYSGAGLVILSGCKKNDPLTGPQDKSVAYVSFTNVNPNTKQVNVFVDNGLVSKASFIAPYATILGGYAGVTPGTRTVAIRDTTSPAFLEYFTGNITVTGGQYYSFYLYDIVTASKLKGILLNTDRTPDANPANAKLRFLNLSPGAPALDFVLVRRETAVAKDSVVLVPGAPYIGSVATPDIAALSAYKSVVGSTVAGFISTTSPASDYILRVKLAGTNTIVASTAATSIVPSRNYTFFARGIYPAVTITSHFNNP